MSLRRTLTLMSQFFSLVRPGEWMGHARRCSWCILLVAAFNVYFAAHLANTIRHQPTSATHQERGDEVPSGWPTRTPHDDPWPAPTVSMERRGFGKSAVDVRWENPDPDTNGYSLMLRRMGWPFASLELKQWGWDWDDPALKGPSPRPPLGLVPTGLVLNPIIIGGGSYLLILTPFVAFTIGRRFERKRKGLCPICSRPMPITKTGRVCDSCVSAHRNARQPPRAITRARFLRGLVWCILITAAINVPFAVTRLGEISYVSIGGGLKLEGEDIPSHWPSQTPHAKPWPAPNSWTQWRGFGSNRFRARHQDKTNRNNFFMETQLAGWPFRVFEQKLLRWNRRDPSLQGPDDHPGMRTLLRGAILNPIAIGIGIYSIFISTSLIYATSKRRRRTRNENTHIEERGTPA